MEKDKTAILDIGSNSVRIGMFADGKLLYKRSITTQLARDKEGGNLSEESVLRTVSGAERLIAEALCAGVTEIRAFATAAVRNALNGQAFCDRLYEATGIKTDVLSPGKEGEAGLLGAMGYEDGVVADIGGGSTEVIIRENGKISFCRSADIGAVLLTDACKRDFNRAKAEVMQKLEAFDGPDINGRITAIGGTANSIAFILSGLKVYDPKLLNGTLLSRDRLSALVKELYGMESGDITEKYRLDKLRGNIIHSGALILLCVMDKLKAGEAVLKENDNIEGYYILLKKEGAL